MNLKLRRTYERVDHAERGRRNSRTENDLRCLHRKRATPPDAPSPEDRPALRARPGGSPPRSAHRSAEDRTSLGRGPSSTSGRAGGEMTTTTMSLIDKRMEELRTAVALACRGPVKNRVK